MPDVLSETSHYHWIPSFYICIFLLGSYLFWTHQMTSSKGVQRMNLATKEIVPLVNIVALTLFLDYSNQLIYAFRDKYIFSTSYDGVNRKTFNVGLWQWHYLGIVADTVFFQKRDAYYINELNVTSGFISRSIKVDKKRYEELVVVHGSSQPTGKLHAVTPIFLG